MDSLRNLAGKASKHASNANRCLSDADRDHINSQAELIIELKDQLQYNQLMLMDLEETVGAITQEREWLAAQVEELHEQLSSLEKLVYGLDDPIIR